MRTKTCEHWRPLPVRGSTTTVSIAFHGGGRARCQDAILLACKGGGVAACHRTAGQADWTSWKMLWTTQSVQPVEPDPDRRCELVVVVAPNAEAVHDHIDGIVEAGEALDTVTTFHRAEELEDALVMLDAGLVGQGPVYAFSDSISFLETGLRELGLLS